MARKYLDTTGLTALWAKIKELFNSLATDLGGKVSKSGDTMTGNLKLESGSNNGIIFKESGYGDKFEIKPSFSGTDDTNYLALKTATGTAGTDPSTTERIRIRPSGHVEMTGNLKILGGELNLNTSGSSSNDSGDIVWHYGNGQEKARIWTGDNPTGYGESRLNFRSYKSDGSALHSTQLATASDVDSKLAKAGDTATGSINVKSESMPANPTSGNLYLNGLYLQDVANDGYAYLRAHSASAEKGLQLEVRRSVNGSYTYNTLNMRINASGGKIIQVSDGGAWRSAIGCGGIATYGGLSSVGFTRSHASVSYKEGLVCNRFGNVVTFAGYFSCGATIGANTTLYSGLPKPAGGKSIYFTWSGYDFYLHPTDGTIRTNGQIVSRTYVGTFTYVCA